MVRDVRVNKFRLDPAGLFGFKIPIEFGPLPDGSTLTELFFGHFELQDETLKIQALPTLAESPITSDRQWLDRISAHWQSTKWRLVPARPGVTLSAIGSRSTGEGNDRYRIIRGPKLDVLILHRSHQNVALGTPSSLIDTIAGSLKVPANDGDPTMAEGKEVIPHLEAAQAAVKREDWEAVIEPAMRASILGTRTLVASICLGGVPEIPAAVVIAGARLCLGQATGDMSFIREAESLAIRSLNTLNDLDGLNPTSLDHHTKELHQLLDSLGVIQGVMHPKCAAILESMNLAHRAKARSEFCFELAQKRIEQNLYSQALSYTEISVQDLNTYMAWIANYPSNESLPKQIVEQFNLADLQPVNQVKEFQAIFRRSAEQELQERLSFLYAQFEHAGEYERALETSTMLLPISRRLAGRRAEVAGRVILPQKEQELALARSLIMHATARECLGDDQTMEETWKLFEEVQQLLDEVKEEGLMRAWLCLAMAVNRHGLRVLEGSIDIIDRGLKACEKEPQQAAKFRRELLTLKSQFLMLEGRLDEARSVTAKVPKLPMKEGEHTAAMASSNLNAALVTARAGKLTEALELLRQGLQYSFESYPSSEISLRILHVAAEFLRKDRPGLAAEFDSAALMIAEENRDALSDDRLRVIFGEAARWHEIHDRLVVYHADKDPTATIEAIDRMRGRSLHRVVHSPTPKGKVVPDWKDNPLAEKLTDLLPQVIESYDATIEKPKLDETDPIDALKSATDYLKYNILGDRVLNGDPIPIEGKVIEKLAQERRATIVMIQPLPDRTLIAVTNGPGETSIRWSEIGRNDLTALINQTWEGLGIREGTRGRQKGVAAPSHRTMRKLYELLIDPVEDLLNPARQLIISPYRELALLPFHLLEDRNGKLLLNRFAISLVPSVAVLTALGESDVIDRPKSAYIVGDPATADKWLYRRLPGAKDEAKAISDILKKEGMDDPIMRTDREAMRESFFTEATSKAILHLACHGELGQAGKEPRIFLSPGVQDDGALLASEIPAVRLEKSLVFLSACETGQGWPTSDGVIGLGRAFLRANASCVVVSLWCANDAATHFLARRFYETLLDSGAKASVAEALRQAMLDTRAELEARKIKDSEGNVLEAQPVNWAPFFVLGNNFRYKEAST